MRDLKTRKFDGRIVVGIDLDEAQIAQLDQDIAKAEFHGLEMVTPILKQARAAYDEKINRG